MPSSSSDDLTDRIYKAVWLHYRRGLSQKEIAARLVVDKATVSRWLRSAVGQGIVSVTVNPPQLKQLEMELQQEFRLKRARVIPSLPMLSGTSPAETEFTREHVQALRSEELGKAAAAFIAPILKGGVGVGLGGGRGVAAFARHLCKHCPMVGLDFFALAVSSREPFAICATSVTAILTSLVQCEFQRRASQPLTGGLADNRVPTVQGHALRLPSRREGLQGMLLAADEYYDDAMKKVELVITGIGAIERCWVLNETERDMLATKMGAVGDILYDIYGDHGTPIKVDPQASVYPFTINRLQQMVRNRKEVIVISAGKTTAIYHALACQKKPFVTGIVTDERTARDMLNLHNGTKQ